MPISELYFDTMIVNSDVGLRFVDVEKIYLNNVNIKAKHEPILSMKDSCEVTYKNANCQKNADIFLRLEGKKTSEIKVINVDVSEAKAAIEISNDVSSEALEV